MEDTALYEVMISVRLAVERLSDLVAENTRAVIALRDEMRDQAARVQQYSEEMHIRKFDIDALERSTITKEEIDKMMDELRVRQQKRL